MEPESLWSKNTVLPVRKSLTGDVRADVAVIGAGLAGILTAYRLQECGLKVVVLEANRIGSGQTKNTTAKITSQHGMIYNALIKNVGVERAEQYARANQLAIAEYETLIEKAKIDCDFQRTSAFLYTKENDEPMRAEAAAASRLGIDANFVRETELPFPIAGAVQFSAQAQFHPLRFLYALSDKLTIYEHTRVISVTDDIVQTDSGIVHADFIVFATHYPFVNVPGWYFARLHQERSYVLALYSAWKPKGMYLGVDADGLSFRSTEGLLLLGGENHRTGENSAGGRYDKLLHRAKEILPDCNEAARWSAQDCITVDSVPYIGQYAASKPNWYVATGFGKWGMTNAMAAAMLITDSITAIAPDWAEVFSPERLRLGTSAKNLTTEMRQAIKGLSRSFLGVPRAVLDVLPAGHGGIVEVEGQKAGVYKNERGEVLIVDPRCPHLGCQVEWNPDEKSWDCPCHGSRFHADGTLMDNPAQRDLRTQSSL